MSKRYFRRREPQCGPEAAGWIEMTGREFYQFVNSPEGRGRHFIDMGDVVLESTEMEAKLYRAERDRSDYLREQAEKWSTLSMYAFEDEYECSGEEIVADTVQDVEDEVILRTEVKALRSALSLLDAESCRLICALYLDDELKTERELAAEYGVSQVAVHKRKKKILNTLKLLVIKNEKSSQ